MEKRLQIGELAKESGVASKTIRFYESIGLIAEPERSDNGYRTYPKSRVQELVLIKNARDLGLPIPRIKKLMMGCEQGNCSHARADVDAEIAEYIGELGNKIEELSHLKAQMQALRVKLGSCGGENETHCCCNVLGQIAQLKKGGEAE